MHFQNKVIQSNQNQMIQWLEEIAAYSSKFFCFAIHTWNSVYFCSGKCVKTLCFLVHILFPFFSC